GRWGHGFGVRYPGTRLLGSGRGLWPGEWRRGWRSRKWQGNGRRTGLARPRLGFAGRARRGCGFGLPINNRMTEHRRQLRRVEPQQIQRLAEVERLRPAALIRERNSIFRASDQILFSAI